MQPEETWPHGTVGRFAGLGDCAWQDGIAGQTLRLVHLAGIHIGLCPYTPPH